MRAWLFFFRWTCSYAFASVSIPFEFVCVCVCARVCVCGRWIFLQVSLCKFLHVCDCVYLFKFNLCVDVFLMHAFESASL